MSNSKVKGCFQNIVLLIFGLFLGLFCAELSIRILRPDLQYAAEGKFTRNVSRIHANPTNVSYDRFHPDTGEKHTVIHNSFGFRQHREFKLEKPHGVTRIGVFGDSFAENLRMPVQYSLSEPLDFLLNQTGNSFEVLNFGTDGYGTDQEYLQYRDEGVRLDLDVVVYLYFENDLIDILADELVNVDEQGNIYSLPPQPPSLPIRIISNFYLTYFLLEASSKYEIIPFLFYEYGPRQREVENRRSYQNLAKLDAQGIENPDLDQALTIFTALMKEMKRLADSNSAQFYVILIPPKNFEDYRQHYAKIQKLIEEQGIEVLDLSLAFNLQEQDFSEFYFKNDEHWNEEGNKIAAIYLFKFLTERLGIEYGGDDFIKENLYRYYNSFSTTNVSASWTKQTGITNDQRERVISKYLALE